MRVPNAWPCSDYRGKERFEPAHHAGYDVDDVTDQGELELAPMVPAIDFVKRSVNIVRSFSDWVGAG